ncbi:S-(hydroxymethyl)glutathione dehydrogenase/alcohol dehydrogenase [Amycolatopsis bartoniae]|uniref:Putative zinc-type alcohol dehydrogenase AdhD n=1 Tax=Amycolatopsis bartoniae TaxID=941986 RepID=A0A8H9M8N4_9PSEU|nr:NDMA-dependent alcohol dehydrogenase [Amycolatopsis bartoniae]MBB2939918.1 S-(hydroxymethyl)glutathione dehydrogenase/alcohol dehydrogenase [Amycolatopsis bartoniae]TVT08298.1 NDMA-dependent alcohol dehydrogenase [Amycolatopsis bartoniae]GHF35689.1 putative zinc-type alcohol dehydrogenase AdhD [Amycolatopsis bartoniae]
MKIPAAVLFGVKDDYRIEEIELDPPNPHEVTVKLAASGLCHSDDHSVTGDVPCPFPIIGGHEGAGVVTEIGSQVTALKEGDHVLLHPVPNCGECRWCVSGRANLCDDGAFALTGYAPDGTYRRRLNGENIGAYVQLGTFATHTTVSETQVVKIPEDIPLQTAALIGCGVTTGFGAATKVADVKPGDVVVVVGVGGVGTSAVQGARIAGAGTVVAVEPLQFRREFALTVGATHTAASVDEATELVRDLTRGVMADVVIVTVGVLHGDLLGPVMGLTSKGGKAVITSVAPIAETTATVSLFDLAMSNKRIYGHVFGEANPAEDFRRLIELYRSGLLKLDEMITTRYSLDQINEGYQAMHSGANIRGLITYD